MNRKMIFSVVLALLVALMAAPVAAQDELPTVGIFKFVSHPALDANEQGVIDTLAALGYVDGETVRILTASGDADMPTMTTIADNFVFDEEVDVIVAISTPALQAAYNVTSDLEAPAIVFSSVTSPYVAGVALTSCIKPTWVTGSQAMAPFEQTVPLIFEVAPDAETVGYIYNTAEANSVANTDVIVPIMEELGLTMEIQEVAASAEVPTAAEALVSRGIDVFYVATDSTVVSGLEGLVAVANENQIPLVASDPSSAQRGAVIAQGLDYYQEGVDAGRMAAAYLNGETDFSTLSISRQRGTALAVNLDAAEAQGVTLSDDFIAGASILIEGGEVTTVEPVEMSAEEMQAAADEFIASLECTDELIAEQQAELDAAAEG